MKSFKKYLEIINENQDKEIRILYNNDNYGYEEISFKPNDLNDTKKREIELKLSEYVEDNYRKFKIAVINKNGNVDDRTINEVLNTINNIEITIKDFPLPIKGISDLKKVDKTSNKKSEFSYSDYQDKKEDNKIKKNLDNQYQQDKKDKNKDKNTENKDDIYIFVPKENLNDLSFDRLHKTKE